MNKTVTNEFVGISKIEFEWIKDSIAILFVSHNDIEHELFMNSIKPLFDSGLYSKSVLKYVDRDTTQVYYIGRFESQRIVYTKTSHMGAVRPYGSISTLHHAVNLWHPLLVIMIGVCAGLRKQQIGDVIVSKELISYEEGKKLDGSFISRASHYYPGEIYKLFDNLDLVQKQEDGLTFKIHKGAYLCGEKLVDSREFKQDLLDLYPESDALEMEGHGIGSACISNRLYNWIIVKGVCDLAEKKDDNGNKDSNQRKGMINAIRVARSIFKETLNFERIDQFIQNRKPIIRNVFISTSYLEENDDLSETLKVKVNDAYSFCRELSYSLTSNQLITHTGVGKSTGNAVVCGIDDYIIEHNLDKKKDFSYSDYYSAFHFSRPFDKKIGNLSYENYKNRHREMIIRGVFSSIFVFGCKVDNNQIIDADGIKEEFYVSKAANKFVIPVGATGYMSRELWKIVSNELDKYYPISNQGDYSDIDMRSKKALRLELFLALNQDIDFSSKEERIKLINSIMDFMAQPWR